MCFYQDYAALNKWAAMLTIHLSIKPTDNIQIFLQRKNVWFMIKEYLLRITLIGMLWDFKTFCKTCVYL